MKPLLWHLHWLGRNSWQPFAHCVTDFKSTAVPAQLRGLYSFIYHPVCAVLPLYIVLSRTQAANAVQKFEQSAVHGQLTGLCSFIFHTVFAVLPYHTLASRHKPATFVQNVVHCSLWVAYSWTRKVLVGL